VLCHGGSGTTFGALELGVAKAGAGLVSGPTADQLRRALLEVLQDGAYHQRAKVLDQAMQAQSQLSDVLDDLARLAGAS